MSEMYDKDVLIQQVMYHEEELSRLREILHKLETDPAGILGNLLGELPVEAQQWLRGVPDKMAQGYEWTAMRRRFNNDFCEKNPLGVTEFKTLVEQLSGKMVEWRAL